jgi:RHH-type proline utilization regulon transcriptional repressor/proline dehydrogenase/delta 1-pyrroline-5-carboxylate dehydrogenase
VTIGDLEPRILARGKDFFASIRDETPSLFNKRRWTGKVMEWCMKNERFKVQLFRFVDVFPSLTTGESLTRHIQEYFGEENQDVPSVLKWGAKGAGLAGAIGTKVLSTAIRYNIQDMARQFIIGANTKEAVKNLAALRAQGFAFTVDVLGEATVSEEEAERYQAIYLDLLRDLKEEQAGWAALEQDKGNGHAGDLDWGCSPKINLSVKPTALYSQARPADFEGSVRNILARMKAIYGRVANLGGFMCIDMESHRYKDITLEVFRRLRSDAQFRDYAHLGIALQAYLRGTDGDLDSLLAWAKTNNLPISIRLVKGAYWDYETVVAKQNGWEIPVHTHKPETDAAFERQARRILENHPICHLACGSHNIRTISAVMETARALDVPEDRYEFQVLYGMAEPVRKGLLNVARRVRLYCPYGELIPGMAYLVRRLLENTANESFLRQSFAEQADIERLLENPLKTLERERGKTEPGAHSEGGCSDQVAAFENEPAVDFTQEVQRRAFPEAIAYVRRQLGKTYPLFIGGENVTTDDVVPSVNPANPSEVIGHVCQAGTNEVASAIAAAKRAFPAWRDKPPHARAEYLFKAADIARRRLFELAAWQVHEVGKQWDQAHADVTEAIDYLKYYAREMTRLGSPKRLGAAPGEVNQYFYEPKGIAAVIAPWNFPLAISCGMASAAIVAGNCVVFKPSGASPVIGHGLVEIFREAGLPAGVFNFVPGRGSVIGDFLIEHPDISLVAFTGSMEVGLRIIAKAARVHEGQANVKKVIAEMGGKNAVIIDDDADLDEAVPGVLASAFGFQGQKCSACSRVIVLDAIYDRFVERLVAAAKSMKIGPAEDPANAMGAVVDASAQKSIMQYIEIAATEGRILYSSEIPQSGYYVPMTIVAGIRPDHRIAQEEIFGPVLAVMRVKDFDQALEWANSTRFALTGGVFGRSPKNLERARREFRVGNLYLNRGITGALVGRQPFGGARMSGVGSKAGGPDYLLQFMDPRTVTENTMRRGFAPIGESDDRME